MNSFHDGGILFRHRERIFLNHSANAAAELGRPKEYSPWRQWNASERRRRSHHRAQEPCIISHDSSYSLPKRLVRHEPDAKPMRRREKTRTTRACAFQYRQWRPKTIRLDSQVTNNSGISEASELGTEFTHRLLGQHPRCSRLLIGCHHGRPRVGRGTPLGLRRLVDSEDRDCEVYK